MDLDAKIAFVTGGSGDSRAAIARALAAAGADVGLSYVGHREGARRHRRRGEGGGAAQPNRVTAT